MIPTASPALLVGNRQRVRDPQVGSGRVSFFGDIILTYVYVRTEGPLCLIPSPFSNSNASASSCRSWSWVIFAAAPSPPSTAAAESRTVVVINLTSLVTARTSASLARSTESPSAKPSLPRWNCVRRGLRWRLSIASGYSVRNCWRSTKRSAGHARPPILSRQRKKNGRSHPAGGRARSEPTVACHL